MTAFPACVYAGRHRTEPGDRFCRLNSNPTVVAPSYCWQCPHAGSVGECKPQPPQVGDTFASMLQKRHGADAYGGCACNALKVEMNSLGPDGCEREADRLAGEVVENLNRSPHWQKYLPDWVKRPYLRGLILETVQRCRQDSSGSGVGSTQTD